MKLRLLILLAAALAASPAAGQTIKSLGYNASNGVVPTTALSNLPLTFTNLGGIIGVNFSSGNVLVNSNTVTFYGTNSGLAFSAGANASQIRNQIGLGATNNVTFSNITASGTLAVTGDTVLSGVNNTMPGATNAASGSSLMTRDLVAQRLPFQLLNYDPVTSAMGAVTSSNGGSGTPSVNKFDLRGGTNTNGVAVWGAGSGGGLGIKSSARGNVGWQGRVSVGWSISRILTNSEVRLQFGKDNSDRSFTALGARGVGIYISNSSVFFETHDGTNHFQTTNSLTTSGDSQNDSWMAVTSNSVASFYKNGTLITNVTNNVPNSQSASGAFGYVIGVQNTTTNNSGVRIFTTPGFILQD